jgi:phosphatidate cytidylyltransferase
MALSSAPSKRGNLSNRILSGLVLVPFVVALTVWGGWPFDLVLALAAAVGLREWLRLVSGAAEPLGYGALPLVMPIYWYRGPDGAFEALALCTILVGVLTRVRSKNTPLLSAMGVPYVGLTMILLAWLEDAAGWPLVVFVFVVVWASDIGAFTVGRLVGGPKLAPAISPNKTWSGFAGGLVFSALIAVAWARYGMNASRPAEVALTGIVLSLAGQGGDLFESAIKRRFSVKDSGQLIPGHGGMLDRIDALLWAVPVFGVLQFLKCTSGLMP